MTDYERGRADERAAVVAWLREVAGMVLRHSDRFHPADDLAARIERGDHIPAAHQGGDRGER